MKDSYDFSKGERGKYAGKIIPFPDRDYSCGAAFCDDPACNAHGPKDADGNLLYWTRERVMRKQAQLRPTNFEELSAEEQWMVDKRLGTLDWEGLDQE